MCSLSFRLVTLTHTLSLTLSENDQKKSPSEPLNPHPSPRQGCPCPKPSGAKESADRAAYSRQAPSIRTAPAPGLTNSNGLY